MAMTFSVNLRRFHDDDVRNSRLNMAVDEANGITSRGDAARRRRPSLSPTG